MKRQSNITQYYKPKKISCSPKLNDTPSSTSSSSTTTVTSIEGTNDLNNDDPSSKSVICDQKPDTSKNNISTSKSVKYDQDANRSNDDVLCSKSEKYDQELDESKNEVSSSESVTYDQQAKESENFVENCDEELNVSKIDVSDVKNEETNLSINDVSSIVNNEDISDELNIPETLNNGSDGAETDCSMVCEVMPDTVYQVQSSKPEKPLKTSRAKTPPKKSLLECLDNAITRSHSVMHLLNAESQILLKNWTNLNENGKKIVSDLYWIPKDLIRLETLIYDGKAILKIHEGLEVKNQLLQNKFIKTAPFKDEVDWDLKTCIQLLDLSELRNICRELKLDKPGDKTRVFEILDKYSLKPLPIARYFKSSVNNYSTKVLDKLRSRIKKCYRLSDVVHSTFDELNILMHLGRLGMDRSEDPRIKINNRPPLKLKPDVISKSYPIDSSMEVDNASIIFRTREEFVRYLESYEYSEKYFALRAETEEQRQKIKKKASQEAIIKINYEKLQNDQRDIIFRTLELLKNMDIQEKSRYTELPPWLRRFTPKHVYLEIIDSGVEFLKRQNDHQNVVKLLGLLIEQATFRPQEQAERYRQKAAILYEKLKKREEAADTLLNATRAKISDDAKAIFRPLATKLSDDRFVDKRKRQELDKFLSIKRKTHLHVTTETIYNDVAKGMKTEMYCVEYYKQEYNFTHGKHFQGKMMPTMFTLLFWDIIYTKPVGFSGIFMSCYQLHPLDMYSTDFYAHRREKIEQRLDLIENSPIEEIIQMMHKTWQKENKGSVISTTMLWEDIEGVASCLEPRALAAICRRLATNHYYTYWGFPDLILWNENTKQLKIREVKQGKDRLKPKQSQWLKCLTDCGVDAAEVYVKPVQTTTGPSVTTVEPVSELHTNRSPPV